MTGNGMHRILAEVTGERAQEFPSSNQKGLSKLARLNSISRCFAFLCVLCVTFCGRKTEVKGFNTEDTEKGENTEDEKTHVVDTIGSRPYDFV